MGAETMVGSSANWHRIYAKVNYLRKHNLVARELHKFQPILKSHFSLSTYKTLVKWLSFICFFCFFFLKKRLHISIKKKKHITYDDIYTWNTCFWVSGVAKQHLETCQRILMATWLLPRFYCLLLICNIKMPPNKSPNI